MHNKSFAAEIAHNVSSRNRIQILERFVAPRKSYMANLSHTALKPQGKGFGCESYQPCGASAVRGVNCHSLFFFCILLSTHAMYSLHMMILCDHASSLTTVSAKFTHIPSPEIHELLCISQRFRRNPESDVALAGRS